MDKTTIENLKQFRSVSELILQAKNEYINNINKFVIKKENDNEIWYKIPIIIDISQNKKIIFSYDSCHGKVSIHNPILGGTAEVISVCTLSLLYLLNDSKNSFKTDLDDLFRSITKN